MDCVYNQPVSKRSGRAAARSASGFTLIEVMVVIAMIGVLTAAATLYVTPRSYAKTAPNYAREVTAICDAMRQRAVASRSYQKLEVTADGVIHWQAETTGMAAPTGWLFVAQLDVPDSVVISAVSDRTHVNANDSVPAAGTGLPSDIDFAPDGSATAATIFVEDSAEQNQTRVAVYGATGSAYAYDDW